MKVYCVFEEVLIGYDDFLPILISIHKNKESAYLKIAEVIKHSERKCSVANVEEWEIEE